MKLQIIRSEKKPKEPKPKKAKIKKINTRKPQVIVLWSIFIFAFVFAIYKNFTAVDVRTEVKETVIEYKYRDTSSIETFTRDFIWFYHNWQLGDQTGRNASLENYFTAELSKLNESMISSEINTISEINDIKVWDISQIDDNHFDVIYSVGTYLSVFVDVPDPTPEPAPPPAPQPEQPAPEAPLVVNTSLAVKTAPKVSLMALEVTSKEYILNYYTTRIYADELGDMVVVRNPTLTEPPKKSEYEPKSPENDGSIKKEAVNEITRFLENFFTLYPAASADELAQYTVDGALAPINKDFMYAGLHQITFRTVDDKIIVNVTVKYLDYQSSAIFYPQYQLTLEKQHNWIILSAE